MNVFQQVVEAMMCAMAPGLSPQQRMMARVKWAECFVEAMGSLEPSAKKMLAISYAPTPGVITLCRQHGNF